MRHRIHSHATHTATVERREHVGEDDFGEPEYDHVVVIKRLLGAFTAASTDYVRVASGERVASTPEYTVGHSHCDDVREGDLLTIEGEGSFIVTGIDPVFTPRGGLNHIVLELEDD